MRNKHIKLILLTILILSLLALPACDILEDILSSVESGLYDSYGMEVHFIDVGQADSTLILCDGYAMLIDGGNVADSSLVYSYLKKLGVDYLDYIICTHAHEDHVGGLAGALNYARAGMAFSPVTEFSTKAFSSYVKYVEEQGLSLTVPSPGDTYELGSAKFTIIGPVKEYSDANNTSIVVRLEYGDVSFLFTGDAERESEQDILDEGYDVSCTVLHVGHHGSSTSSSYRFLYEANPLYAVISVGKDNSYGHPHKEVISRLSDADVSVFRTDLNGTVICYTDGYELEFVCEKQQAR